MNSGRFRLILLIASLGLGRAQTLDLRPTLQTNTHTRFTLPPPRSLAEWSARKAQLRRQILTAAGLYPIPSPAPLHPRRFDRTNHGSYAVEKVLLETMPGYFLAGNLYYPKVHSAHRMAAVLVPHGHWKHGRIHDATDYSVPALCVNLAAQGYVAFAYDMVGYNDTIQTPHDFGESPSEELWAFHPLGLQLWNSMRALDFVTSLDMVDSRRIAVTGASGGATQTLLLAAVDERVAVAAPVNMISAVFQGDDACEMAPGLRVGTNNVEIAAMVAPRPMLLVSSSKDWTKYTPNLEYPAIRAVYRLFGESGRLAVTQIDAGHNYNRASRESVYRFFRRVLSPAPGPAPKETVSIDFAPKDLLIGPEMLKSLHISPNLDYVFAEWQKLTAVHSAGNQTAHLEDALLAVTGAEWPSDVSAVTAGDRILLSRQGCADLVPASWYPGMTRNVTIVVHPDGPDAARRMPKVAQEVAHGSSVLLIEPYEKAPAVSGMSARGKDYLTYHLSDDAYRVQEILTSMAFVAPMDSPRRRLLCFGRARAWCLLAEALSPEVFDFDDDLVDLDGTDEELRKILFIPGLQRAGGLAAVRRLIWEKRMLTSARTETETDEN
jgi:cephalosporin-C deacetylase-like acetyl esterase